MLGLTGNIKDKYEFYAEYTEKLKAYREYIIKYGEYYTPD
jgi:hypothetical protein